MEETVPHKKKQTFNGREMSDKTKHLQASSAHARLQLRPNNHKTGPRTCNRVINESCKQDYKDWVAKQVTLLERADAQGDTKTITATVKRLTNKTRCDQGNQPADAEQIRRLDHIRRRAGRAMGRLLGQQILGHRAGAGARPVPVQRPQPS